MLSANPSRAARIRRVIEEFLSTRLNEKLAKIKDDKSTKAAAKRNALRKEFVRAAWIHGAARRADWIQVVTHSLKPIHPDARGTNLCVSPTVLSKHELMGSHCLGANCERDVVASAGALDVYKFLSLTFDGHRILDLMLSGDPDISAALSDDSERSREWIAVFSSITRTRGELSSDTRAKQLYWLTGGDPGIDSNYHLLAPLFATSLAHRVYVCVNNDRFSEVSKNARQARKEDQFTDHVLHDYPNMAVQKLGGTNPQNISGLNSERGGNNYLLASLPPRWASDVKPLLHTDSMFYAFGRRCDVKYGVRKLLAFLKSEPAANATTRDRRDALVTALVGELAVFGAEVRALPPGWSQSPDCRLSFAERRWLDPNGVANADEQSEQTLPPRGNEEIGRAFARWLNRQLRDPLPMGDPEFLYWCAIAQIELDADEWEVSHAE